METTINYVIVLMIGHQSVSGSCALCQLQDHVTRVLSASGGSVRPAPIIQHLKSKHLLEHSKNLKWVEFIVNEDYILAKNVIGKVVLYLKNLNSSLACFYFSYNIIIEM